MLLSSISFKLQILFILSKQRDKDLLSNLEGVFNVDYYGGFILIKIFFAVWKTRKMMLKSMGVQLRHSTLT